jgi:transcriptional regulator with XRE-family HTH domain
MNTSTGNLTLFVVSTLSGQDQLTQEQLSWQTGIDRKFISALERGVKEPGLKTIIKLTAALEISLTDFMREVDDTIRQTNSRPGLRL